MAFRYRHRIHFRDTDAAGVVFFSNLFSLFHEAYEASLVASGIDVRQFFRAVDFAAPIVHADCDFFRPMRCGEIYDILLTPQQASVNEFSITYQSFRVDGALDSLGIDRLATQSRSDGLAQPLTQEAEPALDPKQASAKAFTRHVVICAGDRQRIAIPPMLLSWIEQWRD
ncbi:MAG: acyl-CoA thioesterase [Elainellaceae cyanobacterium]